MAVHRLKTWTEPFEAIRLGLKPFEYRAEDDRTFEVGDLLCLEHWDHELESYTGDALWRLVSYVLRDAFGVPAGYAVLGMIPIAGASLHEIEVEEADLLEMRRIEGAAAGAAQGINRSAFYVTRPGWGRGV